MHPGWRSSAGYIELLVFDITIDYITTTENPMLTSNATASDVGIGTLSYVNEDNKFGDNFQ
jgi:hypothetical protein